MSHRTSSESSLWAKLFYIDQQKADQVRAAGCQHCQNGVLHAAHYPRKPRGEDRQILGPEYAWRFSFCCSQCRKRTTPESVRFLGRKVYLGATIAQLSAQTEGLEKDQRAELIERLEVPQQTLHRWRHWWQRKLPASTLWRSLAGRFSPCINTRQLPEQLLIRLSGADSGERLVQLLQLLSPMTTTSGAHCMRVGANAQKM